MVRKLRKPTDDLLLDLLRIHVPADYLNYFELFEVRNNNNCYELVLHEKASLVPESLKGKEVVFDGFMDSVSILTHTFSLKKMFLVLYRRRWKEKGSKQYFYNSYDLHPDSIKITPEYASFLKIYDRVSAFKP